MLKFGKQPTQGTPVMRNTLVTLLATLFIACLSMQSYAAKGGEKGPGGKAYERASDNASFKREGGKTGKAEHKRDRDDDYGDWRSRLGDDSDSDSDVKSMDKKYRKEKKNKK
jgi:hypothetical protein